MLQFKFLLRYLNYCNNTLIFCNGFCTPLGSIKLLKLLRFNKQIRIFIESIRLCFKEILSFMVIFFFILLAYVQVYYLLLNEQIAGFSDFAKSFGTCFQMIIGRFYSYQIFNFNKFLGPLIFITFNIVLTIQFVNLFISILNSALSVVKLDVKNNAIKYQDVDIKGYLKTKLNQWFGISFVKTALAGSDSKYGEDEIISEKYRDSIEHFDYQINLLALHAHLKMNEII